MLSVSRLADPISRLHFPRERLRCDFSLYLVANKPSFQDEHLFLSKIQEAVRGGVSCVQLRDHSDYPTSLKIASCLKEMLGKTLLFINTLESIKLAQSIEAEGVYLEEGISHSEARSLCGLYNASTMGGHLLASFGVFLIGNYNFVDPGWRLLYLCGCITALFGCLIRGSSPSVQEPIKLSPTFAKLKNTIWTHRKALFFIAICSGFGSACYSMALILINGLIPLISTVTKAEVLKINTYLLVFDFCALPFFGWIASRVPREQLMLSASFSVFLLTNPLFLSLEGASLIGIIAVRVILVIFGVAFFAPFHAWAGQLVPPDARYAVISLGYALGYQIFGSPTAALSLWCFQKTGMVSSFAWYWMFLGPQRRKNLPRNRPTSCTDRCRNFS